MVTAGRAQHTVQQSFVGEYGRVFFVRRGLVIDLEPKTPVDALSEQPCDFVAAQLGVVKPFPSNLPHTQGTEDLALNTALIPDDGDADDLEWIGTAVALHSGRHVAGATNFDVTGCALHDVEMIGRH